MLSDGKGILLTDEAIEVIMGYEKEISLYEILEKLHNNKIRLDDDNSIVYDNVKQYYSDLNRQINKFVRKRYINPLEYAKYLGDGYVIYYETDNGVFDFDKDNSFTIEELNTYKFYIIK